ncbi:LPXTG cell wall anchor domain-containing protein [Ectobacillus ponti]|uniref:LPXTG cell wall anchor domain-containing protein n=1 Tax=Ectobacillus ponti TaxID=2961894 RepID=A0AA41X9P1_9BACI|nr:leucine-rich repeat domain-containing protein [Ectobacillus ponti]MCP8967951.1 LPXTG cell wall anchor domain-containing protein [Ectobacillus ponti]
MNKKQAIGTVAAAALLLSPFSAAAESDAATVSNPQTTVTAPAGTQEQTAPAAEQAQQAQTPAPDAATPAQTPAAEQAQAPAAEKTQAPAIKQEAPAIAQQFEDADLARAVAERFHVTTSDVLTQEQLDTDSLVLDGSFSSIKGLEAFRNLTAVTLTSYNLKSADLSSHTKLQDLTVYGSLQSIKLPKSGKLKHVDLSGNHLATVDLTGNPNLETIDLAFNGGDEGRGLTSFTIDPETAPAHVYLEFNALKNLPSFSDKNLKDLRIAMNEFDLKNGPFAARHAQLLKTMPGSLTEGTGYVHAFQYSKDYEQELADAPVILADYKDRKLVNFEGEVSTDGGKTWKVYEQGQAFAEGQTIQIRYHLNDEEVPLLSEAATITFKQDTGTPAPTPTPTPAPSTQTPAAPSPVVATPVSQSVKTTPAATELPDTATSMFNYGLAGLLTAGLGLVLGRRKKHQ